MLIYPIPRRKISIITGEIQKVIWTILSGKAIKGQNAALFEQQFADYLGTKYVFAVSSGRSALRLILKTLNFPQDSEIILPAYTDESVPWAIINEGLKPVFCDIRKEDFNIDINQIRKKITTNTKAIIITHIFGSICDIEELLEFCNKHGIYVIEDCAHAPGAVLNNKRKAGSLGHFSYFSFNSTKHFHSYGGGCVACNNEISAKKIKKDLSSCKPISLNILLKEILITWLIAITANKFIFSLFIYPILLINSFFSDRDLLLISFNKTFKKITNKKTEIRLLTNLQAAIALLRLKSLDYSNINRIKNIKILQKYLKKDILDTEIKSIPGSIYYFYILLSENRNKLSKYLLQNGIDTGKYVMRNVAALYGDISRYPICEQIYENSIQIPIHSYLNPKEIKYIADILNNFR
ncbi:MAG: aminotransferase class I/II-fold pyridoxal phosphate-dependent enzyme [Candidatus Omnitrophota bacterium]